MMWPLDVTPPNTATLHEYEHKRFKSLLQVLIPNPQSHENCPSLATISLTPRSTAEAEGGTPYVLV
jgi:hypothetical protein